LITTSLAASTTFVNDYQCARSFSTVLHQLSTITQGTHSIQDHNARFSLLVQLTDEENEQILVNYYQKSLNYDLLQEVWRTYPQPHTLASWMTVAQVKDNKKRELSLISKGHHKQTRPRRSP
jgi:hypothetical protein